MKKQENTLIDTISSTCIKSLSKKQMNKILGGERNYEERGIESAEGEGEEEGME